MSEVFHNVLKPFHRESPLHYTNTDGFILRVTEGNIADEHMVLSNLDVPNKTNNKVTGKLRYEIGSKIIEEFVLLLLSKTYSLHATSRVRLVVVPAKKGVGDPQRERNKERE